MKREELLLKLVVIEDSYLKAKKEAIVEYCDANNPYKIGDVFTDHMGSILIEEIKYTNFNNIHRTPSCIYHGVQLNKNGTVSKLGNKRDAYQIKDIKHTSER